MRTLNSRVAPSPSGGALEETGDGRVIVRNRHNFAWLLSAVITVAAVGCAEAPRSVVIEGPFVRPTTLAVAPVLNFSGQFDLDPLRAADLLSSELSYVEGVTVLPVNRVVAVLAAQGKDQVESPAHALSVADAVGADAILVAGVMEYDAYTPVVGIVLQMYAPAATPGQTFDAVTAARMDCPFDVTQMADPLLPTSQIQTVYNAAYERVRKKVRRYAEPRTAEHSLLGWRAHLKIQELYLRFCWNDALTGLMNQERSRRFLMAGVATAEEPA